MPYHHLPQEVLNVKNTLRRILRIHAQSVGDHRPHGPLVQNVREPAHTFISNSPHNAPIKGNSAQPWQAMDVA